MKPAEKTLHKFNKVNSLKDCEELEIVQIKPLKYHFSQNQLQVNTYEKA